MLPVGQMWDTHEKMEMKEDLTEDWSFDYIRGVSILITNWDIVM